ncbi:hypothetical protein IJT17_05345 [bacterium]|nr:hypothetical protein [bacterium]
MQKDGITLEYKMAAGEVLHYKSEVVSVQTVQEPGAEPAITESTLNITIEQKVVRAIEGSYELEITISDGTVKTGSQVLPLENLNGQKISMAMKRNGDIYNVSANMPFSQPSFPTHPLKLHESWKTINPIKIPLNEEGHIKNYDLEYTHTLSSVEAIQGYDVAVVSIDCPKTDLKLSEDAHQTITAQGKTKFAHTLGRLVSSYVHTHTVVDAQEYVVTTDIKVSVDLEEPLRQANNHALPSSGEEQFILNI